MAVALGLMMGCAMRVTGMVVDSRTGGPISSAMVAADDGRNRTALSDAAGLYSIKTDGDTASMTVSAPGYDTVSVPIPGGNRFPYVQVEMVPIRPAGAQTIVPVNIVPVSPRSTAKELEEVESLYNRGLISGDEYKRMRTRIIDGN